MYPKCKAYVRIDNNAYILKSSVSHNHLQKYVYDMNNLEMMTRVN